MVLKFSQESLQNSGLQLTFQFEQLFNFISAFFTVKQSAGDGRSREDDRGGLTSPPLPPHTPISIITLHAQRKRGKVIGVGVLILYTTVYVCGPKKIELYFSDHSPFQTFAVGLLVEFIDWL